MNRCLKYHLDTVHTYESIRKPHFINWNDYPSPFKVYNTTSFKLPPFPTENSLPFLKAFFNGEESLSSQFLSFEEISALCFAMNGITKIETFGTEPFMFRSAPSAGALYPFELYLFIKRLSVPDGIYHYQPLNHSLELLSEGDYSKELESIFCIELNSNILPIISFIHPRSAWKYRKRAYRYCLLDCGHLLFNGLIYLKSIKKPAAVISQFCDAKANSFMNFDKTEFVAAAINIGSTKRKNFSTSITPIKFPSSSQIAQNPIILKEIAETHTEGNISSCKDVEPIHLKSSTSKVDIDTASLAVNRTIFKRRSRRNFTAEFLEEKFFYLTVRALNTHINSDWKSRINALIIATNIKNIPDGIYRITDKEAVLLSCGNFSEEIAYLSLGQSFLSRANLNIIFCADLVNSTCHNYREILLEAGIKGEIIYLLAESKNLGACGVGAFFDIDLKEFLNLKAEEYPVYIVSIGTI
ncbi:SagB/ThcOx family dehydrogenase [Desulfurobacterium atlanticum]|uniref:SagB-type dehydrogenase domain-containing protein n=1 Tax=Desulfurobacterium atlanticum TaxID=240169 RepID=A0A238Y3D2_9BACT|nr:SagB/ThcOx family dehydrogenase [Desulfurobacterium atlanticum]SNR65074.1 SagB-type dehydrogenase domain-containing protein [Desulfurobacterium atlanticum]